MRAVCVRGRHFNGRQLSDLNNRLREKSSSGGGGGGGLMRGIKIPQQDFALKMQGELMREGGGGGGGGGGAYLRDTTVLEIPVIWTPPYANMHVCQKATIVKYAWCFWKSVDIFLE